MTQLSGLDEARRRLLVDALGAGLCSGALVFNARAQADKAVMPVGVGKLPDGTHTFRTSGGAFVNGQPMQATTAIPMGSTVHTAVDSEAIFVVGSAAFLLRENTRVTLRSADGRDGSPARAAAHGPGVIQLISGKLLAVFGGGPRRLETASASIRINGTGLYLESANAETYFCLCYGKAEVRTTTGSDELVNVVSRHHDQPLRIRAPNSGARRHIVAAPFINHTDQELALIEALVGRLPPFIHPNEDYRGPRSGYRR